MTAISRRVSVVLAVLVGGGAAAAPSAAAPGDLDRSFGAGTGVSRIDFSALVPGAATSRDAAAGLALQPDGRILVAGSTEAAGTEDMAVARLLADGGLDRSYGLGTGGSRVDFSSLVAGATRSRDEATAVAVQPDGRIVVAGDTNATGNSDMAVVRLTASGALDTSYGSGTGGSRMDFDGRFEGADALALRPDGKIVAAGSSLDNQSRANVAVAQLLNPSGLFDGSFGAPGFIQPLRTGRQMISVSALVPGSTGTTNQAYATALEPDGRILVGGYANPFGHFDMTVVRLTAIGTLDTSYGGGTGFSRVDFSGRVRAGNVDEVGRAMAVQADGKILLAGWSDAVTRGTRDFSVVRLNAPEGTIDGTFGIDGQVVVPVSQADDQATDVAVQPDGKILIAGEFGSQQGGGDLAVLRLQPNGTVDAGFGQGGRVILDLAAREQLGGMALQADGRIVLAGTSTAGSASDMMVVRLEGDPAAPGAGGGAPGGAGGAPAAPGQAPSCEGRVATIVGTAGADRLRGTRRADVIVGLGGNDRITAAGGNDVVCAGGGRDVLGGARGNDRLFGQGGADNLNAGPGRDFLNAGPGRDRLKGGGGPDTLLGGGGRDRLNGGGGRDREQQ